MIAEFAVYLQELCKRNTQQLFVLLLERLSENTINARSKVTSRAHCRLPPDRIAHTRQRCVVVGVHILKDRNKLVAQADVECRILRLQLLEGFRRVAKYVEREFERCKTMLARTLRLEIVCSVSAKRQQFIILGTVQLVDVQFESRSGRKVILLVAKAREDHTRKHKRGRQPHFITVHQRRTVFTRLPLIRTVQLYIPCLTAAKHIVLRYGERSSRSGLVIAFHLYVEVQFGIIRLVECRMNIHIQRIAHECRITRGILHLKITEDAYIIQTLLHAGLTIKAVKTLHGTSTGNTRTVLHLTFLTIRLIVQPSVNHIGTYPQLVVIIDAQAFVVDTVIRGLSLLAIQIKSFLAYIKRFLGNGRHAGSRNHAHGNMSAGH